MMTKTMKRLSPVALAIGLGATALLGGCSEQPAQNTQTASEPAAQVPAPETEQTFVAPQISVQLWSVKDALQDDFKGTLEKLAALGFDGVEFAGDFGPYADDPAGLKAYLSSIGLTASGAHVQTPQLKDNLEDTVEFYQALGIDALIIPWDDRAFNGDDVKAFAAELTALSEALAPYGMQVGFHNHAQEWADYGDTSYFDYIASHTPESVILQQDVGWTVHADKDPIAFVRRYPGRTLTTHFKSDVPEDSDLLPIIGKDDISWSAIYRATVLDGGAEWIVIEQEVYPDGLSPMDAVAASKAGFDAIIAE